MGGNQTIARNALFTLVAIWLGLVSSAAAAGDADFEETHEFLQVVIGGKTYRLDSLIVKAQGAKGQLPVALITNGTGRSWAEIHAESVDNYAPRARDLALRGWLAVVVIRRGIGHSGGSLAVDKCGRLHVERDLDAAADDLQAAIDAIKKRPDVDSSRIIALGVSTGGAGVVALGARNPSGLVGVVSVSGGLRFNCAGWDDKLIEAYRKYGAASHVPNLWLYAGNDSIFGPDIVGRLQSAFRAGAGDVTVKELLPFRREGHFIFSQGGMQWLGELDMFLQSHNLPTWRYSDASELLKRLHFDDGKMQFAIGYITAPVPKAMAFSPGGKRAFYQYDGKLDDLVSNRNLALARCQKANNTDCTIVMENNRWVGSATQ